MNTENNNDQQVRSNDLLGDIMDALATVRVAFKRANLEPPTALILGSNDDGMRFLSAMRQTGDWVAVVGSGQLGHPVEMADGSMWMELEAMGMKVRWPANRIATPDGRWSYT